MISLYSGVPGSGKTYKMVHDLAAFLEKNPDITIISNIRDLRLGHTDFENFLDELFPGHKLAQQIEMFFDYDHQQKLNEKFGGPVMYVLDECQLYFPRRMSLPKTEAYLQRHRHLGHFIYLASQSSRLVNSSFIPLIETEYHAARRTISFLGEIHYKEKSPQSNQIIRSITVRPKKKILDAAVIASPNTDKLLRERDKLLADVSRLTDRMSILDIENEQMRFKLEEKERVFLPVVLVGCKKMTIYPDTSAYVELKKIKRRVTCVGDEGLKCYFDREVNGAIRVYGSNDYSSSLRNSNSFLSPPQIPPSGGRISIDADLVPKDEITGSENFSRSADVER
jgi:hypothetical protein